MARLTVYGRLRALFGSQRIATSLNLRTNAVMAVAEVLVTTGALFALYKVIVAEIGIEALGVWSIVAATTAAARLGDMGVSSGMTRFVALHLAKGDETAASELLQTSLLTIAMFYAALSGILYVPANWLLPRIVHGLWIQQAQALLPFAFASLSLNSVAGVGISALAGMQRSYLRSWLNIAGTIAMFILALFLMRSHGLVGIAVAQCVQAVLVGVSSWIMLKYRLPTLPRIPCYWSFRTLRPILGYGGQLQLISLCLMLFDPVTKLAMSRFGGLEAVAVFELCSRLVVQSRAILVNGNQILISTFAHLQQISGDQVRTMYRRAFRINLACTIVWFLAVMVAAPLLSMFALGRISPTLLGETPILALGWGLNVLAIPVYVLGLGVGELRYNVAAHAIIAGANPMFTVALGWVGGPFGVVIGSMLALASGTAVLLATGPRLISRGTPAKKPAVEEIPGAASA